MDANCNVNCPTLKTQTIAQGNQCSKSVSVGENIDGCKLAPSDIPVIHPRERKADAG